MTLTLATLITGLLLTLLGVIFLLPSSAIVTSVKRFPRSRSAAYVLFGLGAAWFLFRIWHLSAADFGQYRKILFCFFAAVTAGAFFVVPDFLAVRGACVLVLLGAGNLLEPGFMNWDYGELTDFGAIYVYKLVVFTAVALVIYLGAAPFRLRDFLEWLYRKPGRAQWAGGVLAVGGVLVMLTTLAY